MLFICPGAKIILAFNLVSKTLEEWNIQECTKNDASEESSPSDCIMAGERDFSGFLQTLQLLRVSEESCSESQEFKT